MVDKRARNPGVGTGHGVREQKELVCMGCGRAFLAVRRDAERCSDCKRRHSNEADNASRRLRAQKRGRWRNSTSCPVCGKPKDEKANTCWDCIPRGGENNANWKGGRSVHPDGYVLIRTKRPGKHPYQLEHILVWESANGPLPKGWNVHHLNGVKTDNRLENLVGLPAHEHHSHPHKAIAHYEERIRQLEAELAALKEVST